MHLFSKLFDKEHYNDFLEDKLCLTGVRKWEKSDNTQTYVNSTVYYIAALIVKYY